MTRYEQVKDSNRQWAVRNKAAKQAISARSYAKKLTELIQSLGGKCTCGAVDGLKVMGTKKEPWVQCNACFESSKLTLKTRQPGWNSIKAKKRRETLGPVTEDQRKKQREASARYRAKHPHRKAVLKAKRRAAKKRVPNSLTREEWNTMLELCDYSCLKCRSSASKLTIDHVVPLDVGGDNTAPNIQPLCQSCNSSKGLKSTDYRPEWWPFKAPQSSQPLQLESLPPVLGTLPTRPRLETGVLLPTPS